VTPQERLFGWRTAFDHPVTLWVTVGIGGLLVLAPLLLLALGATGRLPREKRDKILTVWRSWLVLAPAIVLPVLAGAAWVIAAAGALSIACHREYARATGLFRERTISAVVVLAIAALFFAVLDHWYGLFVALWPLSTVAVAAVAVLADRPQGYIQRVALAIFAIALVGAGLAHLAYFANDALYRPLLLWLIVGVELNDVLAFTTGRIFGRRKLCPATSPNKTVAGAVGAFVLTTALVALLGRAVFAGTPLAAPAHLLALGAIVSVAGQLGDLTLSSIKRDVGVKDLGVLLPGHGGLLDRFDSLLLAAPAVFHYVGYFTGIGLDQPTRILTQP
jgi:phosphatidate cytidylyltransferase